MTKNTLVLIISLFFAAYSHAQNLPLTEGIDITLRNTLQDPGEAEATYASLFGQADDAFDEFATLSYTESEFPTALAQPSSASGLPFDISGLYDIDLTENSIHFTALPDTTDPFWGNVFGLFPEGKFDRYYFTFSAPHNITSFTSDHPSVNLRIDSETVIVVEISEGYDLQPGISFSIDLNPPPSIVIEVTLFDLNEGVDPAVFQARDAEIEEDFASQQPGFLKRLSGVDANGQYVVMVFWETLADADASIAAFGQDPTVGDYFAMIDGNTFSAERYTTFSVPDINFDMVDNNVIEITTFNLNEGVDPVAFVARDAEIEAEFASLQPGFIRRTSGVDANGKYAVIVFWETLADADASIAAFGQDPTVGDYFAMIDGNTFAADRYTIFGNATILTEGVDITLRNTLQDPGEAEATYASLFGQADDAFDEFATLSYTESEFPTALAQPSSASGLPFDISGLYDIDLTENSIHFTALPDTTDPFWGNVFGLFPEGKFDRYYFTFSAPHNITSFTSDHPSVNLRIDSETVIVVEISEGYDLQPGISFSIDLNTCGSANVVVSAEVDCNGAGNTSYNLSLNISGGTAPYQLTGSYNGTVDNTQLLTNIPNNVPFTVNIVDANGCTSTYTNDNLLPCITLSISLLDFSAKAVANGNQLNWATVNETNNNFFTIEHSTNGTDFAEIHNVKGAGNSTTQQNYAFLHETVRKGTSYYRLSQTDYDGTATELGIISINQTARFDNLAIYPSPVIDVLQADFINDKNANIKASIYNINGERIYEANYNAKEGFNRFSLNVENYPAGVYFLKLNNGKQLVTQKFIKQ